MRTSCFIRRGDPIHCMSNKIRYDPSGPPLTQPAARVGGPRLPALALLLVKALELHLHRLRIRIGEQVMTPEVSLHHTEAGALLLDDTSVCEIEVAIAAYDQLFYTAPRVGCDDPS